MNGRRAFPQERLVAARERTAAVTTVARRQRAPISIRNANGHTQPMGSVPTLIASSVVRGAKLAESHGGLCLVDFVAGTVEYVVDWNSTAIDVEGRGGDRGLRGVATTAEHTFVLASQTLLQFDRQFTLVGTFGNRYLKHCHELAVHEGRAYAVSTGFDSVLVFDLQSSEFVLGFYLHLDGKVMRLSAFDPRTTAGPAASNLFHLNCVACDSTGLYLSGLRSGGLLRVQGSKVARFAALPEGTHNAQPFRGGVLYNDTARDRLCGQFDGRQIDIPLSVEPATEKGWTYPEDTTVARPLFARGLCALSQRYVAGGSSPSTITIYDVEEQTVVAQAALSADVRNAVHGLAVWSAGGADSTRGKKQ